jgi:hypothetical protein
MSEGLYLAPRKEGHISLYKGPQSRHSNYQ